MWEKNINSQQLLAAINFKCFYIEVVLFIIQVFLKNDFLG